MNINVKFVDTAESGQSQLNVEAIRESIVSAVRTALDFLRQSGFEFEQDLNIAYICGKCALGAQGIMRANGRRKEYQDNRDTIEVMKIWLSMSHNLIISDEAVDEWAEYMTANRKNFTDSLRASAPHEFDNETDIFIYKGINSHGIHGQLIHELWHLIESKAGVFKASECIHEGTATYVQKRMRGLDPARDDLYKKTVVAHSLYDIAAKIVDEEIKAVGGSLSTLLEPAFRKRLADRVKTEVLPIYFKANNGEISDQERSMTIEAPHYAAFVQDPSRENLIESFRSRGAVKLAKELEGQDISSYLAYMREVTGKPAGHI
jgi:hypothetical protein